MGRRGVNGDVKESTIWALRDVSFEVNRGEAIGIVGRNGAGKSTLLKVISRVLEPTRGRLTLGGSVVPMLEVLAGLDVGEIEAILVYQHLLVLEPALPGFLAIFSDFRQVRLGK